MAMVLVIEYKMGTRGTCGEKGTFMRNVLSECISSEGVGIGLVAGL
jgi:hypothetical protein